MLPAMVRYKWCEVLCGEKYELYNQGQMHRCHIFFFCMWCTHMLKQRNTIILIYLEFFLSERIVYVRRTQSLWCTLLFSKLNYDLYSSYSLGAVEWS